MKTRNEKMASRIGVCVLLALICIPVCAQVQSSGFLQHEDRTLQLAPTDHLFPVSWGGERFAGANHISDGLANTQTIVSQLAAWNNYNYAAAVCANLNILGHNDWYLPSINELQAIHRNRTLFSGLLPALYWSSSEDALGHEAQLVDFSVGYSIYQPKNVMARVRCVRRLTDSQGQTWPFETTPVQPIRAINSIIEQIDFHDPRFQNIPMYSVTGLSDEARRFRNNSGVNQLRYFDTRKDTYARVLRQIAFQAEFDASSLTNFFTMADDGIPLTDQEDWEFFSSVVLSATDFSAGLVEHIAEYSNLRYVKNINDYSRNLNKLKTLGRHIRSSDLRHFNTALTAASAVTNALRLSESVIAISLTTTLLEAAKIDMGIMRLERLQMLNIMTDPAYNIALSEVLAELRTFSPGFWSNLIYSIRDNQFELISGQIALAGLATNIMSLLGANPLVTAWVSSVLFVVDTGVFIHEWRHTFREATCAATIYKYMLLKGISPYRPLDEDVMDYLQFLFLKQMEEVLSNNYMRFWEYASIQGSQRREVRVYFRDEHNNIKQELSQKRISRFAEVLFGEKKSGAVSGLVLNAESRDPIENVAVYIYRQDQLIQQAQTNSQGAFLVQLSEYDDYNLSFQKEGFLPASYSQVKIQFDETTHLEAILQVGEMWSSEGAVKGKVLNAFDRSALSGITLRIRSGINERGSEVLKQVMSRHDGSYRVEDLPGGNYTIEASGDGFATAWFTIVCLGGREVGDQNLSLTPLIGDDSVRIILDWGRSPADLDSHLTGPRVEGSGRFHIYFSNKAYRHHGANLASLDLDVTNSFGPETVTISNLHNGLYRYSVHNYTHRNARSCRNLSNSGARVRVYRGAQLIHTFHVPSNQEGTLWTVFEIANNTIVPVNQMSYSANPEATK